MEQQKIIEILRKTHIFSDIPEHLLTQIASISSFKEIAKNKLLIRQNTKDQNMYVIVNGIFSVYKDETVNNKTYHAELAQLSEGATVGEMSFLDDQERSANVKATTDHCGVIQIPNDQLERFAPRELYKKLAKKLSYTVRTANENTITHLQHELDRNKQLTNMGYFITYTLAMLSCYNLALKYLISLTADPYSRMFASAWLIVFFVMVVVAMLYQMGFSLKNCGCNLSHWKSSLIESLLSTSFILLIITIVKWLIIIRVPRLNAEPIFNLQSVFPLAPVGSSLYLKWTLSSIAVYSFFVFFQEFISRGVLQSMLQNFLQQKHKYLLANLVTTSIFATMHVHLSNLFALAVVIPSLFWGWLYMRHNTLVGPVVSHIIIGIYPIFVLGGQDILR